MSRSMRILGKPPSMLISTLIDFEPSTMFFIPLKAFERKLYVAKDERFEVKIASWAKVNHNVMQDNYLNFKVGVCPLSKKESNLLCSHCF